MLGGHFFLLEIFLKRIYNKSMTDREKVKKELRKAVREVFMKYKREGLWSSSGQYEYHFDHFRLPFSMSTNDTVYNGGYISFDYKDGVLIILSKDYYMAQKNVKKLSEKIEEVKREIDKATLFWRTFYKVKNY